MVNTMGKNRHKKRATSEASPKTMQPTQTSEATWEMKREKLGRILGGFYSMRADEGERICEICGEANGQLYKMNNGLLVCASCMDSEVTSMQEAAELLFTTYGNFKRLFKGVTFRYPALRLSEQSMHNIENVKPRSKNRFDLVKVVDNRDTWMSLCVARDIPRCLLEELYVRCFSDQIKTDKGITSSSQPHQTFSSSEESTGYYLDEIGREKQAAYSLGQTLQKPFPPTDIVLAT